MTAPAWSAAPRPPPLFHILDSDVIVDIREDGSSVGQIHVEFSVDSEAAARQHEKSFLAFVKGIETVEFLGGHLTKPDGKRLDLAPSLVGLAPVPNSIAEDRSLNRWRVTVSMPRLDVGDKLVLNWRRTTKALFIGNFTWTMTYVTTTRWDHARVTLSAPAAMRLNIWQRGAPYRVAAAGDQRQYVFETGPQPDGNSEAPPSIAVSTFANWPAFGRAYFTATRDRSAPDPAIAELARSITQGIDDRVGKIRAVYNWVASNISWTAFYIDDQNFIPRSARETLANRSGDCKDQATLLIALLRPLGIEANMVLLQVGRRTEFPSTPVINAINHVIAYVPDDDLYLDTTAHVPFGQLLDTEYRHMAVHATEAGAMGRVWLQARSGLE